MPFPSPLFSLPHCPHSASSIWSLILLHFSSSSYLLLERQITELSQLQLLDVWFTRSPTSQLVSRIFSLLELFYPHSFILLFSLIIAKLEAFHLFRAPICCYLIFILFLALYCCSLTVLSTVFVFPFSLVSLSLPIFPFGHFLQVLHEPFWVNCPSSGFTQEVRAVRVVCIGGRRLRKCVTYTRHFESTSSVRR